MADAKSDKKYIHGPFVRRTSSLHHASGLRVPTRVVNGSVLVQVHGGSRTVKEKVEPDPDPELIGNRFLGSGSRTIYGTGLQLGPGLGRE